MAFYNQFYKDEYNLVEIIGDWFITDLKYNTEDNFIKKNVYKDFNIFKPYVNQDLLLNHLIKIVPELKKNNLKLVIFDAFRPLSVQKVFWEIMPDDRYIANPANGSNHNRGTAIDVGLAKNDGTYLQFPSEFDEFNEKAHLNFTCNPENQILCDNRELLLHLMVDIAGLKAMKTEWWHFELHNAKEYPIIDIIKK